ncbi:Na(+)-translocating NADH-quinone reductase subunit D [Bacteroidia bacterium]|nr:Na(+)-translocating NADH-quinone reductase subunit D [Bacteroidia bacterium]
MATISKERRQLFSSILKDNPSTARVLAICSALAVTVKLESALYMAVAVIIVLSCSNVVVSLLKNTIPPKIKCFVQLLVVSTFVVLIDLLLKAFVYDMSKQLTVFVGLIIVNSIIIGRLEAFAMTNKIFPSFVDGLKNGFNYGLILVIVAIIRELLGSGKLLNMQVIPQSFYDVGYMDNSLMLMPPMAIIILGVIVWIQNIRTQKTK